MTDVATESFIDRAMGNVRNAWRDIAVRARLGSDKVRPDLPKADAALLTERIEECLEGRGGEVSARARAADGDADDAVERADVLLHWSSPDLDTPAGVSIADNIREWILAEYSTDRVSTWDDTR